MKEFLISSVLSIVFLVTGIAQNSIVPKLGKDPVKKVIAAMTLEEKAALVVGTGMRMPGGPPPAANANPAAKPPASIPLGPVIGETHTLVAGAAGTSYSLPVWELLHWC
jgi:beta-glucosidase